MKRSEVDLSKLSPMMRQYMDIKAQYEDSIVFFRLGDFYEMFFEDAIIASRELELALTGKQAGLDERVPMCGIPFKAYSSYLDKLIEKGYKVAICEQLEDPKMTKDMVKRDVIQVVTKGTRLDRTIDAKENNFIASIYDFEYCYVLSYADISTGEFYCLLIDSDEGKLLREINRLGLQEVIVNDKFDRSLLLQLREVYQLMVTIVDTLYQEEDYQKIYQNIKDIRMVTGIRHLLHYLLDTKKGDLSHLQEVTMVKESDHLLLNGNTMRNLELTETMRTRERQNSLLWFLDKNKTAMGSRFLKQSIESPLTNRKEIERRYDFVDTLRVQFILRDDLREALDRVYDLERLGGRIAYGNLNARDLLQLKSSLKVLPTIQSILTELHYDKTIDTFEDLYLLLEKSINEDAPVSVKEGSLIKNGYHEELDNLRSIKSGSKEFLLQFEQEEKDRTGIRTLKVGYNKIFGYYIEVSKGQIGQIKEEFGYERRQTLSNCERFVTPLLKEKENIILGAEEKIIQLEYQLFMEIREEVKGYIGALQKTAKVLAEVDMLQAFSQIADDYHFVRPILTEEKELHLVGSRHPVVERVMKEKYVENDILMDKNTDILLITGPNMAGKSTYMRQLAITVILAQMGSFVPCTSCTMPIFDKIFTRIGASDDLVSGESTFMVEMKEANEALQEATEKSLILFDELGRGTATYGGMSLAQAILEYIHDQVHCKTLFSTHYHELTELEDTLPHLKNVHVSAQEEEGKIIFLHKVKKGAVDKSYGIHVASLALLPTSLITRAKEILSIYETQENRERVFTQTSLFSLEEEEVKQEKDLIREKLSEMNPLSMTPIEALNALYQLKEDLKQETNQKKE